MSTSTINVRSFRDTFGIAGVFEHLHEANESYPSDHIWVFVKPRQRGEFGEYDPDLACIVTFDDWDMAAQEPISYIATNAPSANGTTVAADLVELEAIGRATVELEKFEADLGEDEAPAKPRTVDEIMDQHDRAMAALFERLNQPIPAFKVPDLSKNPELIRLSQEYRDSLKAIHNDDNLAVYALRFAKRAAIVYGAAWVLGRVIRSYQKGGK